MQPSAKRRAGNQIGKDNDDDEVEGVDPGTWQSDPDQISRRRKVKARRAGEMPEGGASVPSSYNPFSEISLAAPSLNLNQIAETNLLPSAEVRSVSAQFEKKEQPKDLQDDVDFRKSSGLGLHSTPNPFAVLSSSHLGREGIDGLGNYPVFDSTPLSGVFGALSSSLFQNRTPGAVFQSCGNGYFLANATSSKSYINRESAEVATEDGISVTEVFSGCTAEFKPLVQLPETQQVNGEEDEQVMFSSDSTLFEYDSSEQKWRERGKGGFKLNVDKCGQARLLMRQSGNLRLLLNAKVFAGMSVQLMQNGNGISFGCSNHAATPDIVSPDTQDIPNKGSDAPSARMSTWCLRFRAKDQVSELVSILEKHKRLLDGTNI